MLAPLLNSSRPATGITSLSERAPDLDRRDYARRMAWIALLLVAVGLAARILRQCLNFPIWGDEAAVGLNVISRDYAGLTRQLDLAQVAPILFLWVERFVFETLGGSEWALRLLPWLAGIGGLLLFWDIARRLVPPTAATLAVGMLAAARWPITLATSLKPYSGDLFWSALILALAVRWYQRPGRLTPLVGLVLAVPFALAGSYPTVFVAGAISLYLLPVAWRGGVRARVLFGLYNLFMMGTFVGCFLLVGQAQIDPEVGNTGDVMLDYWKGGFPPDSPLGVPLWLFQVHTGRMFAYPIGDANGGSLLTFLLFLLGAWQCRRPGTRSLLVLCLTPLALNLIAAILQKYPYGGCCRLSQNLAPAICLLAGLGWAAVLERLAPRLRDRCRWVWAGAAILIVFTLAGMMSDCAFPYRDVVCQWSRSLTQELDRHLAPGDVIVVAPGAEMDATTVWYLRRFGDRVVWEKPVSSTEVSGRVWVLTFSRSRPATERQDEFVRSLAGWRAVSRQWYNLRPDRDLHVWHFCGVTCLTRPDDLRDPPQLAASP